MEILRVENLTFKYPLCDGATLKNMSFDVNAGEFITICGATGSGKSTLVKLLKRELAPLGEKNGDIFFKDTNTERLTDKESACKIGYVMQRPEQQIVTDKVWHELAFGLENMGLSRQVIASRVAEMCGYFGMESWYEKNVSELSGGQKQLLNLASVMVMQPDILILDEPTAQLDPIAASDFISTIKKLNEDFSLTVIIIEHRLEEVVPISDRVMVIDKGCILEYDSPIKVINRIKDKPYLMSGMPAATRIYGALTTMKSENVSCMDINNCPMTVKDGRKFIKLHFKNNIKKLETSGKSDILDDHKKAKKLSALTFKDVYFRYERNTPDILCGLNLDIFENEIFCILGGNGSGKTTTLGVAANLLRAYSGTVKVFGKKIKDYRNQSLYRECLSYLPQDVQTVFLKNTVGEELLDVQLDPNDLPYDISHLYHKHPYDLSGGEQQLLALAKVLATKPKLLLLDEPTKGLDANAKQNIIDIINNIKKKGVTVVIVTHDVEFASIIADRCALFFKGRILSCSRPNEFFSENSFYTTAASRMTRGIFENVVTVDETINICKLNQKNKIKR